MEAVSELRRASCILKKLFPFGGLRVEQNAAQFGIQLVGPKQAFDAELFQLRLLVQQFPAQGHGNIRLTLIPIVLKTGQARRLVDGKVPRIIDQQGKLNGPLAQVSLGKGNE